MAIEAGAKNGIFEVDDLDSRIYERPFGQRNTQYLKLMRTQNMSQTIDIDLADSSSYGRIPTLA